MAMGFVRSKLSSRAGAAGAFVVVACAMAADRDTQEVAIQPAYVEQLVPVSVLPHGWTAVKDTIVASPDSAHVAIRIVANGGAARHAVFVDSTIGPSGRVLFGPTFSDDSQKVASVVSEVDHGFLHVDRHRPLKGPDPVAAPVFSPDGQRVAYVGRDRRQRVVFVDGRSGVFYDELAEDSLMFSPDSKHIVFVARRGPAWFVVVDGQEGKPYARIATPGFSPDSNHLAYWAMSPSGSWVVVADGQEDTLMSVQDHAGLSYSPDSSRLAAFGKRNGRWHAMIDRRLEDGHDALGRDSLVFSPNSRHVAYAVMDDRRWRVVLDGRTIGDFDALMAGSLRFSPDSSRLAYVAKDPEGWFAVIGDERHHAFDRIATQSLRFSPDSQRFAYVAKNNTQRVSVIVDGYRWAICDGVEDLVFSPDSASVVWVERRGRNSRVVVDGVRSGHSFDQLVPGASLVFDSPGVFHTLVIKRPGPVIFRYDAQLTDQMPDVYEDGDPFVLQAVDPPGQRDGPDERR